MSVDDVMLICDALEEMFPGGFTITSIDEYNVYIEVGLQEMEFNTSDLLMELE